MSARLPSVRGDVVVRTLKRAGFEVVRIKGSHHVMEQRGLLRKIIDDAGLTVDEFCDLL